MTMFNNFLDVTLGERPEIFDWEEAMRKGPNPEEERKLQVHARACHFRQVENKWMFSQIRVAQYRDRKLLLLIAVLAIPNLLGFNVADIIAKFLP